MTIKTLSPKIAVVESLAVLAVAIATLAVAVARSFAHMHAIARLGVEARTHASLAKPEPPCTESPVEALVVRRYFTKYEFFLGGFNTAQPRAGASPRATDDIRSTLGIPTKSLSQNLRIRSRLLAEKAELG